MHGDDEGLRELSGSQGENLLRLARRTIGVRLGLTAAPAGADRPVDPELHRHRATFVTLKIKGRLRGCMGSLQAVEPLIESIGHNAVNAAFNDPRFPPLTGSELTAATIEVSILTDPRPLAHEGAADLLRQLTPGQDGVIIRQGGAGATFLPQVWEQLPQKDDFLTHLCLKAGLSGDTWRRPGLEVSTYRVQHFEEQTPCNP